MTVLDEGLPEGWIKKRLMHLTPSTRQIMYGIVLPGPNVESGIPIVKSGDCVQHKLQLERLHRTTPEIEAPYARARLVPGDIVYAIRGSIGMAAIVPEELRGANLTQDAARIAPRSDVNSRWLLYAVQSHVVWSQLEAGIVGATVKGINIRDLKRPFLPVPPRSTQERIAAFLDRKTAAIDALIAKKERLIDVLEEKRQTVITEAVTKGLDPTAPMKDSGIPWIGQVPRTWKILPVKRTARSGPRTFTDGDWIESPFITEEGVRLIQTGNVGIGRYKEQGFRYVSDHTFHELRCTEVDPGDVLICRLDGPVGRACLAPNLGVKMITSVDNAILKARADCDARYLVYVLSSSKYLDWVQVLCRVGGGFRFRVSRSMLGDIQVPVPPAAEQRGIADLLDIQTARSVALEQRLELHCERLREYRKALITAVISGKIDVSKEAA